MIPWIQLDTATIPGEDSKLRLMKRGAEFSIMLGSNELMNSRLSGSEEALATLTCQRIQERPRPRVLIGGMGMGFTLRAALISLPAAAEITVAELVPAVVAWAKGPISEIFGQSLTDPRVHIQTDDVSRLIAAGHSAYDAILLDVDNGPEALTSSSNSDLYGFNGLAAALTALRQNGVLAVWSSGPDASFHARLRRTGFDVDEVHVRANGKKRGARHVIWLATKPRTLSG